MQSNTVIGEIEQREPAAPGKGRERERKERGPQKQGRETEI